MKLSKFALASAIASALCAGTAFAAGGVQQPSSIKQTAFESYYSQDPEQSPSDQTASAEPASAAEPGCAAATACDSCNTCGCDSCGCDDGCCGHEFGTLGGLIDPCCKLDTPWTLFGDNECLKCKGVKIAGWITQSYTYNPSYPADKFNGPVTLIDRSNEYMLNQAYIYVEKATDASTCCWDFGYRIDTLYGTDNRFTTASGLETRSQFQSPKWSTQRFYGPAAPQFYVEAARNDWKIKAGHWYSPVGYEVVPSTGNFFSSLPYTFQYGEPFTHTGVIATKKVDDQRTFGVGVIQGWDNFDNSTPNPGFIDTYTRTFCDKSTFGIVQVVTQEPVASGAFRQRFLQTNVYTKPLDDKWTYVAQSDFGWQNDALANGRDAEWYGLNQYLFYKVSDCFSWGFRGEWFRDEDGYRVGGFLGQTPAGQDRGLNIARSGYAGNFYELTFGANYKPNANWNFRPSIRQDWFDGNSAGGPTLRPFDGGNSNNQTLLSMDVIATF